MSNSVLVESASGLAAADESGLFIPVDALFNAGGIYLGGKEGGECWNYRHSHWYMHLFYAGDIYLTKGRKEGEGTWAIVVVGTWKNSHCNMGWIGLHTYIDRS